MKEIGERMRAVRKAKDMRATELSRRSGVHRETICNYENGKYFPNLRTIICLADALEVSLDEYIGRHRHCGVSLGSFSTNELLDEIRSRTDGVVKF